MQKQFQHTIQFTVDAAAGGIARETITVDGHQYEIVIGPRRQIREAFEKQSVSLGPRGSGVCEYCGK